MELEVEGAIEEIQSKTNEQIEEETARKWGARACGCYALGIKAEAVGDKLLWLIRGEDFRHEALEHAALIGDRGVFLTELQKTVDEFRNLCVDSISI